MFGAIRKRDVLSHPKATIQCFGWKVFFRTLVAGKNETFLSLLMECGVFEEPTVSASEVVERSIELERRASRLYRGLADRFADGESIKCFLSTLAKQEQAHADLLAVCRAAARKARKDSERLEPCARALPRLESKMGEVEARAREAEERAGILRLVLEVEASEINRVFEGIVAESDSPFVRAIDAFREATRSHLEYIARRITDLDPDLAEECLALAAAESLEPLVAQR